MMYFDFIDLLGSILKKCREGFQTWKILAHPSQVEAAEMNPKDLSNALRETNDGRGGRPTGGGAPPNKSLKENYS